MSTSESPVESPTLEQAMARLDQIAGRLESGELELAESLALYEEGIRLLRVCDGLLNAAETQVEQLRADGEGIRLERFTERP